MLDPADQRLHGPALAAVPSRAPAANAASRRLVVAIGLWTFLVGNAAGLVWLWWHGGNVTHVHTTGDALTSAARLTGLLGAYLALIEVVLLARLPFLERLVGFDRLTLLAPLERPCVPRPRRRARRLLRLGLRAAGPDLAQRTEISTMLGGGIYPG